MHVKFINNNTTFENPSVEFVMFSLYKSARLQAYVILWKEVRNYNGELVNSGMAHVNLADICRLMFLLRLS